MADPAVAIRAALVTRLKASGVAKVYDEIPSTRTYPYTVLGPTQSIPEEEGADTGEVVCLDGTETFQQIDVWSKVMNYTEVGAEAAKIRDALRIMLTITGHRAILQEVQDVNLTRDDTNGLTRARITFRLLTQPA